MIPVQQENTTPKTPKTEKEEKKKKRFFLWWWILLLLILLIAVGVIVWALFIRAPKTENTLAPDYAPRQVEQHARVYGGETSKLEQTDGGGAVTLEYTTDINISLSEKKVYFSVANPYQSNQSMLVQIKIKDEVIAESGTLQPGYKLGELDITEQKAKMLSEGVYDGQILIWYYQPDTGERAVVNTAIPVSINVQ